MVETLNPSVIVVGGGAFGTSTAYHLSKRGYTRIKVLDRFAAPSKDAAATDLNKIVRYDYPNPLYTKLGLEAMAVWKDPNHLLSGLFRHTGWIMSAHNMTQDFLKSSHESSQRAGMSDVRFMDVKEIKRTWPEFTGDFDGWTNLWSPEAGWVPSGQALLRLAMATCANGVEYVSGDRGWVQQLLYNDKGACIGVLAKTGEAHLADIVVLCTGANTAALIEARDEIVARSHCVGVIQLTTEEAQKYKNLPIVDDFEQGILFPPDENNLLKLCSCRFITNYYNSKVQGASLGHSHEDFPEDGVPRQIEEEMREFVRDQIPELADREWVSTRMCWDGDTKDVNFRICPSPTNPNLFIGTAGSGHGFKFMPVIGKYIADLIEGKLDNDYGDLWRWRFGATPPRTGKEPHPWPARDLGELDGWKGRNKHVTHQTQDLRDAGYSPCQACTTAGEQCSYPVRDKSVTVSESYLRGLQSQLPPHPTFSPFGGVAHLDTTPTQPVAQPSIANISQFGPSSSVPRREPVPRNSTAEAFVSGLRKLSGRQDGSAGENALRPPPNNQHPDEDSDRSRYEYVPLKFDSSASRITIRLPPYPYAVQLVHQFESYIGYEYHWYLHRPFHTALELTYSDPHSLQSRDRIWLCKLLTVLALGESYNVHHAPLIEVTEDENGSSHPHPTILPGAEFFEQALSLFKLPSEEPTIPHVEALNLIAFYCYSLNRRKTAYTYTGLAVRLSSILMLHKPRESTTPALAEHYKQLWWTTLLMDTMTSSECALTPVMSFQGAEHSLPSNSHLSPAEQKDFLDSELLAAHLTLSNIRQCLNQSASQIQQESQQYHQMIQAQVKSLDRWQLDLPPKYAFDFVNGIPASMLQLSCMRSLSSLYLRYFQGYVVLIRPVFFKVLAAALGTEPQEQQLEDLIGLSLRCLEAADFNMRILISLSRSNKITKYGFWESLHLFSAISVSALARLVHTLQPSRNMPVPDDSDLYAGCKDLLQSMAAHGNAASKGHLKLIVEIEELLDSVSLRSSQHTAQDALAMADLEQDIFQWISSIDEIDSFPM